MKNTLGFNENLFTANTSDMNSFFLSPFYISPCYKSRSKENTDSQRIRSPRRNGVPIKIATFFLKTKFSEAGKKKPYFSCQPLCDNRSVERAVSPNRGTCNPRSFDALKTSFRTNARLEWKSLVRDNASTSILPLRRL